MKSILSAAAERSVHSDIGRIMGFVSLVSTELSLDAKGATERALARLEAIHRMLDALGKRISEEKRR